MFDKKDPRAALKQAEGKLQADLTDVKYAKFYEEEPNENSEKVKTWWARGQNFFLEYSEVAQETKFVREEQVDEYVLLLPDSKTKATVEWGEKKVDVEGNHIVFIPEGTSKVTVSQGRVVRLFTVLNTDLNHLPINKAAYKEADKNVKPFEAWPQPVNGPDIRVYSLDVPNENGRFGTIYRSSTFMVNFLDVNDGPRDPSKLSPHSHDDFEQCSLILEGDFVHHFRWPWTPDKSKWKEDQHENCGSPSVTVIPPGVIHTSEAVGKGKNQLVDIFCAPRMDFSKQDGWVLNTDDYPIKEEN